MAARERAATEFSLDKFSGTQRSSYLRLSPRHEVAHGAVLGFCGVLADGQRHGRVGPGWALGARDGGGHAGLRTGRLRRGGAAVPGGAPPGGCREPVAQSHELSRSLLRLGTVHRRGPTLPAGAGAPRADPGARPPAINPCVGGECGPPPQAAPGAVPAAMVPSESDGSPCPAHPGA